MLGVREKATGSKKPNATARCFCCNNNNSMAKNHRPAEFISNSTVIRLFYYWAMWAIQTRATIGAELTLVAHQRATFLFSSQSSVSSALLHSLLISHCIHFCSLSAFCDHVGVRRTLTSESALCINKPIILGEIIFTVKMKSMEFHRSKERRVENFTSQRLPSLDDPVWWKTINVNLIFSFWSLCLSASAKNPHHRRQPTSFVGHRPLRRRRPTFAQLHRDWG